MVLPSTVTIGALRQGSPAHPHCSPLPQAQADALVHRMGLPADVTLLIRHLWLSFVPRTGFLDIDLEEMWVHEVPGNHACVLLST